MGLFNKKKDIEEDNILLPDLPETEENLSLPSINDLSAPANLPDLEINNLNSLEELPNDSNQNVIKSAINHQQKTCRLLMS